MGAVCMCFTFHRKTKIQQQQKKNKKFGFTGGGDLFNRRLSFSSHQKPKQRLLVRLGVFFFTRGFCFSMEGIAIFYSSCFIRVVVTSSLKFICTFFVFSP